jgi:GDP-4-dehydro-6-deoxy-D-mannose reductase
VTDLLVTGADGFVGRWVVKRARERGYQVRAGVLPGTLVPPEWGDAVEVLAADITTAQGIARLAESAPDQVIHLAALASGSAARRDPALAWCINAGGTAALAEALARRAGTRLLCVSTGEVYGRDHAGPIPESARPAPCSPYAASKLGSEIAVTEVMHRTGLDAVIARPFPHTGPGQTSAFVLPALAERLRTARRTGADRIEAGDLSAVRDLLDVRDVADAYLMLLERGERGEVYNVARGTGFALHNALERMAAHLGVTVQVTVRPDLLRPADVPVLIGDPARLVARTGWQPQYSYDQTLQDLVDAQAD